MSLTRRFSVFPGCKSTPFGSRHQSSRVCILFHLEHLEEIGALMKCFHACSNGVAAGVDPGFHTTHRLILRSRRHRRDAIWKIQKPCNLSGCCPGQVERGEARRVDCPGAIK
eukprot:4116784-Amphidinium_carterae.1